MYKAEGTVLEMQSMFSRGRGIQCLPIFHFDEFETGGGTYFGPKGIRRARTCYGMGYGRGKRRHQDGETRNPDCDASN